MRGYVCTDVQNRMEQNQKRSLPISPDPPALQVPWPCEGASASWVSWHPPEAMGHCGSRAAPRAWSPPTAASARRKKEESQYHQSSPWRMKATPTSARRRGRINWPFLRIIPKVFKRAAFERLHSCPPETTISRMHHAPHQTNSPQTGARTGARMVGSCVMTNGFPVVAGIATRILRQCPLLHSLASLRPPLSPLAPLWRKSLSAVVDREQQSASFERLASSLLLPFSPCQ